MTRSTTLTEIEIALPYHGLFATQILASGDDEFEISRPSISEFPPQKKIESPKTNSLPDSLRDNWNSLGTSCLSDDMYKKISALARKPNHWRGAGSKKLSSQSLSNFLLFWRTIRDKASEPFLTLAPSGNIYAEWHASWRRHLDLEFTPNGKVYFGLFNGGHTVEGKDKLCEVINSMLSRRQNPFRWKK